MQEVYTQLSETSGLHMGQLQNTVSTHSCQPSRVILPDKPRSCWFLADGFTACSAITGKLQHWVGHWQLWVVDWTLCWSLPQAKG